jgi:hypothetical protein
LKVASDKDIVVPIYRVSGVAALPSGCPREKRPRLPALDWRAAPPVAAGAPAAPREDVVDYFNGDDYNRSVDGRRYPIHLSSAERKALLAFLRAL